MHVHIWKGQAPLITLHNFFMFLVPLFPCPRLCLSQFYKSYREVGDNYHRKGSVGRKKKLNHSKSTIFPFCFHLFSTEHPRIHDLTFLEICLFYRGTKGKGIE